MDTTTLIDQGRLDRGADYHLTNWARWMRSFQVGLGFKNRSVGLECMTSSTFDDMHDQYDKAERNYARVSNAIIESLTMVEQCAIHNIYLGSVWRFRGDQIEVFLDAADKFWTLAKRRGLS